MSSYRVISLENATIKLPAPLGLWLLFIISKPHSHSHIHLLTHLPPTDSLSTSTRTMDKKPLTEVYRDLLLSGQFSDFTIRCGGHTFPVHRAVICPQTHFFDVAANGPFAVRRTSRQYKQQRSLTRRCGLRKASQKHWTYRLMTLVQFCGCCRSCILASMTRKRISLL